MALNANKEGKLDSSAIIIDIFYLNLKPYLKQYWIISLNKAFIYSGQHILQ